MVTHRTRAMQELNVHRKMAHCASATFSSCHSDKAKNLAASRSMLRAPPEDGASASVPSSAPLSKANRAFKHSLQLLVRSPCQHSGSTTASSVHSIPPSNWQNLHCNRKEG